MAFGRLERTTGPQPMSDINMTPLIDVMLVLLVIFIIAAPLMTSSLKLELPQAETARPSQAPVFITVSIDAEGQLYLDEERLDAADFASRLTSEAQKNPQLEVQLRADKSVPYGRVAELLDKVQQVGLSRIGFVTETPTAAATTP
jgi:biopolymer transport protein ExbD/biopolymer transport protein TolR